MHGYFDKESVTWKVSSEAILNLGGARAVLMQIAHPLVAQGVSAHSRYMQDPFGRAESTFMLGQMLAFGSTSTARQAARTINQLHKPVRGTLPAQAGAHRAGTSYSAQDPALMLWVHATLIDTILLLYPMLVGPMSEAEQETYYQESKRMARLLGLSEDDMPTTVHDLRRYVDEMVKSDQLAATPEARQLAQQVLFPPAPVMFRPLMHLHHAFTVALLPPPIREIYAFEWGPARQALFQLSTQGMRALLPHLSTNLRVLPVTRKLMKEPNSLNWTRRWWQKMPSQSAS